MYIKIKDRNVFTGADRFDFELEDGTLLHCDEWNGENYTVKEHKKEIIYNPVYDIFDDFKIIEFTKTVYDL